MQPAQHHAFLRHPDDRLERFDPVCWESFCRGERSLCDALLSRDSAASRRACDAERSIDLLLVFLRRDAGSRTPIPELVQPLRVRVDEHGYLRQLHIELAPLGVSDVVDLRPRLVGRYLRRTWQWRPTSAVVQAALALCDDLERTAGGFGSL